MSVVNINPFPPKREPVAKKHIIIPKYAPLYAMIKCCGPTTSPIRTPLAVPVDIIGELLAQRHNTPEIFEVVPIDRYHNKYTDPIKLTLDNYKLPYSELCGAMGDTNPTLEAPEPAATHTVTEPAAENTPSTPITDAPEINAPVADDVTEPEAEESEPEMVESVEGTEAPVEDIVEDSVEEESVDPITAMDISDLGLDDNANEITEATMSEFEVIPKEDSEDKTPPVNPNQNMRNKKRNRHK